MRGKEKVEINFIFLLTRYGIGTKIESKYEINFNFLKWNQSKRKGSMVIKMNTRQKKWIKTGLLVLAAAGIAGTGVYAAVKPESYHTVRLTRGSVEEVVEGDGEIKSGDYHFYYAAVTAPIEELHVKRGEKVRAGEQLVVYDVTDLQSAASLASSQANEVYAKGNAMLESNERLNEYVDQAFTDYDMASFMTDYFQMYVDYTRDELAEYELRGKDVEKAVLELEDCENKMNFMEEEEDREKWRERAFDKSMEVIGEKKDYLEIDEVTMKKHLQAYEEKLAEWKAKKEKYETKAESKLELLTPTGESQIGAAKQSASIQKEDAKRQLSIAEDGIVAGEDGIVSEVLVEEGSFAVKGAPLFVVQDVTEKKAEVYISKYDIGKVQEGQSARVTIGDRVYTGEVSRIYQIAQKDSSDKAKILTEITIHEPDDQAYLGLEAEVEIIAQSRTDVMLLPVEAVYTDDAGSYCYCIQDGKIAKQYMVTGISDGNNVEILEGLNEKDEVILDAMTDE